VFVASFFQSLSRVEALVYLQFLPLVQVATTEHQAGAGAVKSPHWEPAFEYTALMPTSINDVTNRLATFGSKEGEFNQSRRLGQSTIAGGQVDEGYCQGVCTDWIRRVIGGGRLLMTNPERLNSQTNRQATIQINLADRNEKFNAMIPIINQLNQAYNAQVPRYNINNNDDKITISQTLQQTVARYLTFTARPDRTYPMDTILRWRDLLREVQQTYDNTSEVGWRAFAQMLDNWHLEQRQNEERDQSSKRFSQIRIVASTDRRDYGGIRAGLNQLLQLDGFTSGRVLLLGFGLNVNGRVSGHAVAAFRQNQGTYIFFDPNFGVFRYSLQGVFSALQYLFGTAYGVPIYGEDRDRVIGNISYILFART
jgi:hypothetical protein